MEKFEILLEKKREKNTIFFSFEKRNVVRNEAFVLSFEERNRNLNFSSNFEKRKRISPVSRGEGENLKDVFVPRT